MLKTEAPKGHIKILTLLGFVLFAVSVLIYLTEDFAWYRCMRGVVSFSFLGVILYFKKSSANPFLLLFLTFYGVSSILTVWYENGTMAIISLTFNFLSFLALIVALFPKVSFKRSSVVSKFIFVVLMMVNAYLLYQFIAMLRDFTQNTAHYAVMLLGAISLLIVAMLSLLYNDTCSTRNSLLFTLAIFSFIFAEVFRAMGYYDIDFGNVSVYIARFLVILASALLASFVIISKTETEKLGRTLF